MTSIRSYLILSWIVLVVIIYIPDLVLLDSSNSTCTNFSNPSDVWLNVPSINVDEISLVVENLKAHVSLSANVANLVSLNAGVDISTDKINLTMKGIEAQVQLAMHLDNIAKIITRTLTSLDLLLVSREHWKRDK